VAVYDSTMARFGFLPMTRLAPRLTACAGAIPEGRILSDAELEQLHTLFVIAISGTDFPGRRKACSFPQPHG